MKKVKILFVCLGNICRSPTAQGVMEHMVEAKGLNDIFHIDSAGTGAWHVGGLPDERSQEVALKRGYDLSNQRARKVSFDDFEDFDLILAADNSNIEDLQQIAPHEHLSKIKLILSYASSGIKEVPDPYYGGGKGFEQVLDLLEDACEQIIAQHG